jgi:RimJ/RimL family protein N-acetyltransferase
MTLPISTERLRLRSLRQTDLAEFLAYRTDPAVARFQSWDDTSPSAAADFLRAQVRPSFSTRGTWQQIAIALAGDDRLIGDIGFFIREDGRSAELGITVATQHQGLGLAREALTGLIEALFTSVTLDHLDAVVDARNVRATRLLARLGFQLKSSAEVLFKGAVGIEHTSTLPRATWTASPAVAADERRGSW